MSNFIFIKAHEINNSTVLVESRGGRQVFLKVREVLKSPGKLSRDVIVKLGSKEENATPWRFHAQAEVLVAA